MSDLLVVVPSRGRPENVARLIKETKKTKRADTEFLFGFDSDDPCLGHYLDLMDEDFCDYVVQANLHQVVAWMNHLSVPRTDSYRFIGLLNDDNVPRSNGWDEYVIDSLDLQLATYGYGMCFGNDLYPLRPIGSLPCHIFMSSNIVKTLGYMGPPCFRHMWVDNVWLLWGQATSIEFLEEAILEHMHPSCDKAEDDDTYRESLQFMRGSDMDAFHTYRREGLDKDIEKIRALK